MTVKKLLQLAIEKYEKDEPRESLMIEECGELITELARIPRHRTSEDKIIEELADVLIVGKQLALIYGEEKVCAAMQKKLDRLADNMGINENDNND